MDRSRVIEKQSKCVICGSMENLEVHHVVPGLPVVVVLCRRCHKGVTSLQKCYYPIYANIVKPWLLDRALVSSTKKVCKITPELKELLR